VGFKDAYAACGASAASAGVTIPKMTGREVTIDFTYTSTGKGQKSPAGATVVSQIRFHLRRAHWGGLFGKDEPKFDPGDLDFTETPRTPLPQLAFEDAPGAWISRVVVPGNTCVLPKPQTEDDRMKFHVLIQAKAGHS